MKNPTNNWIAVICVVCCVGLTVYIFSASRADSGLRMAALVSSTSIAAGLIAIASTLLTGKDVTKAEDLPPGSSLQQTSNLVTTTPPTPNPPPAPNPASHIGGGVS